MFTHIVLLKFKDQSPENIAATRDLIMSMEGKIESLQEIEVGIDVVRSERSYDLAIITRFADRAGYDAYALHPVHLPILAKMGELIERAAAVDFEG